MRRALYIYIELLGRKNSQASCQIILHCICKHYCQPEKAGQSRKPDQLWTPSYMHEKKHDARHLGKCNSQSNECICSGKYPIQIDPCDYIGEYRADNKHGKNQQITREGNMQLV